jgi:N-methylhydantoinase A/oxoprolinase/acetone carboxylase beta subunit
MSRTVRIGIDVGGTFTKAVAIDNETLEIIGKSSVLTTHLAAEGVAAGVVKVFKNALQEFNINPKDVVFLAHSTTQATNALLEGDVASVGIVGMGSGMQILLAKSQTAVGDIDLAPGRVLKTYHTFINTSKLTKDEALKAVEALLAQGAKVIVASDAFSVDTPDHESLVIDTAISRGVPATGGHEISKLYGLTVRTRTAVINASILPKMIETAAMTEESVQKSGIAAPLMIMRGDGGVMDTNEMRKRPVLTMLSGPAATVAGALMYLRVSDGIFFEVGGTSTNIGVIRNGRPTIKSAEVGGHRTYVDSLDIRVIGIAGGSMPRVKDRKVVDVGPRSAHIAGLPYAAFAKPEDIVDPRLELFQPRPSDPSDYVSIRVADGKRFAITNTCAANVLGIVKPGDYSYGSGEAARLAIVPLARTLGKSAEDTARQILQLASAKIVPVINSLTAEYKLDLDQLVLVGGGGGAASLIPFTGQTMNLRWKISDNAEVISSIGVALAMVRDSVERVIVNPTPEDIVAIKQEAKALVFKAGAKPETVEVHVEINPQQQRVRAIAIGATELRTRELRKKLTEDQLQQIAAESMGVPAEKVVRCASTGYIDVFTTTIEHKTFGLFRKKRHAIRVLDKDGFIRVQRSYAVVAQMRASEAADALKPFWERVTNYNGDSIILPDVMVIIGGHIVDLSGMQNFEQARAVASTELLGAKTDDPVVMIGIRGTRAL